VEDPAARNVIFIDLWRLTTSTSPLLSTDDQVFDGKDNFFDNLNAKTALYVSGEFLEFSGLDILVFISLTLVDQPKVSCPVDQ
jgi:hypothetical protein